VFLTLVLGLAVPASSAPRDSLDLRVVDGQISIHAEAVSLRRLLGLLDRIAGTESTVPANLAERTVSVQFQNLDLEEAIRKIFEGRSLDYAVLGDGRVIVTGEAGRLSSRPTRPPVAVGSIPAVSLPQAADPETVTANPFQLPGFDANAGSGGSGEASAPPAFIQTPFGPVANPGAAGAGAPGSPAGQGFPFVAPGQSPAAPPAATDPESLFPPQTGAPPGSAQPSIFGNRNPPLLDQNSRQTRTPDSSQP
jgi:hypothetical protein